jgi:hypothetical protein
MKIKMDKSKYGVHQTHCCTKHGCKYGDEDCPVVSGEIKQDYICESCDYDGINSVEELFKKRKMMNYEKMWNELKFWLNETAEYKKGFVKNAEDLKGVNTLKEVEEKIKEIENMKL